MLATPETPNTLPLPLTPCDSGAAVTSISRSSSQQNIDTDSGKSSCSPALLDCSFDSGIGVGGEVDDLRLLKRIQQCKRILIALERDKEGYRKLRERLSKLVDKRNKEELEEELFCNVCCAEIYLEDAKTFVTCCNCNKKICRGIKCADWIPKTAQWECQLCHSSKASLAQTSSWVAEQMSFNAQKLVYPMRARSEIFIPISDCNESSMHFESVSQIGGNSAAIGAEQKLKIREYVEEVVASMLGGTLDNITVGQMSKSDNYLQLFYKCHKKLSNILRNLENALCLKALKQKDLPAIINGQQNVNEQRSESTTLQHNNNQHDFADISQARLRQLIESIIAETLRMPAFSANTVSEVALNTRSDVEGAAAARPLTNGVSRRHRAEHYFEPKNYQDLLATAVLNKIADKQNNGRRMSESTPDLSGHTLDSNFIVEDQSTTSGSSVEPRSDCSGLDNLSPYDSHQNLNDVEPTTLLTAGRESVLSDYIATHMVPLPDLSAPATESEEEEYASESSTTLGDGNWEDNWLFKKKRASNVNSSMTTGSVGMLVPAPKEDVRAQIGDKTADEVSDLSEMDTDTDDSSLDMLRNNLDPPNGRLLNKHLIGGQNTKMVLDELIDRTSMISSTSPADNEPLYTETKNVDVIGAVTKTEAVNTNMTNGIKQDAESVLLPPPVSFEDIEVATFKNPLSGSIAEREYMKWNNAVDMPNNPYAPEALKRRISGSQERFIDLPNISPSTEQNPISLLESVKDEVDASEQSRKSDYKRYSRDYYINNVKESNSKRQSSADLTNSLISDDPAIDNITINEVISHGSNASSPTSSRNHSDCHWTLSTPVRRSSSLKFINNRASPQSHYNYTTTNPNPNIKPQQQARCSTSTSHYNDYALNNNNDDDNVDVDVEQDNEEDNDIRSQRSWKSASAHLASASTLPKRRTLSSLSFHSNASAVSFSSSASKKKSSLPSGSILTQFEKQLLHKDLKRNSFRAISATTKDFVMNPLFDRDQFYGDNGRPKLSLRPDTDDQVDSGVDSCLNGFSETDAKNSSNSLLF